MEPKDKPEKTDFEDLKRQLDAELEERIRHTNDEVKRRELKKILRDK